MLFRSLAPILNRDRGAVADRVKELIQTTLDNRSTGINILRVNVNKVDPPSQTVTVNNTDGTISQESVVDAFRDVQAAEQERDRVERQADAYANRRTAEHAVKARNFWKRQKATARAL